MAPEYPSRNDKTEYMTPLSPVDTWYSWAVNWVDYLLASRAELDLARRLSDDLKEWAGLINCFDDDTPDSPGPKIDIIKSRIQGYLANREPLSVRGSLSHSPFERYAQNVDIVNFLLHLAAVSRKGPSLLEAGEPAPRKPSRLHIPLRSRLWGDESINALNLHGVAIAHKIAAGVCDLDESVSQKYASSFQALISYSDVDLSIRSWLDNNTALHILAHAKVDWLWFNVIDSYAPSTPLKSSHENQRDYYDLCSLNKNSQTPISILIDEGRSDVIDSLLDKFQADKTALSTLLSIRINNKDGQSVTVHEQLRSALDSSTLDLSAISRKIIESLQEDQMRFLLNSPKRFTPAAQHSSRKKPSASEECSAEAQFRPVSPERP